MDRAYLLRAAELARAAADAATIAASFARVRPGKDEHYALRSEEALYAAIEALFEARMGQPSSLLPLAGEITQTMERAA